MSARPRLTPHQRDTLDELTRWSSRLPDPGWVQITRTGGTGFGSIGAVRHLIEKGYAEANEGYGPRGGHLLYARPVSLP